MNIITLIILIAFIFLIWLLVFYEVIIEIINAKLPKFACIYFDRHLSPKKIDYDSKFGFSGKCPRCGIKLYRDKDYNWNPKEEQ